MSGLCPLPSMTDPAVLAMPERLVDSAWLGHIPFAMWLVSVHRPLVTVELGVHNGASFCAMAQAAGRIGDPGHVYGVDHWLGDIHAGTHAPDVYWDLIAYHAAQLRAGSTLMRMTFDEAAVHFTDGSLDLLHIDGLHTYEAVQHDFITWLPKMGPRGVVLFHDVEVRDNGFGVWRLWDELTPRYPSFRFTHSYGLGVLYVGSDPPPDWMQLLSAEGDGPVGAEVRTYFARLGYGIIAEHDLRKEREEIGRVRAELQDVRMQAQHLRVSLHSHGRAISAANAVVASHSEHIGGLQRQATEREGRIAVLTAELADERAARDEARAALAALHGS